MVIRVRVSVWAQREDWLQDDFALIGRTYNIIYQFENRDMH